MIMMHIMTMTAMKITTYTYIPHTYIIFNRHLLPILIHSISNPNNVENNDKTSFNFAPVTQLERSQVGAVYPKL